MALFLGIQSYLAEKRQPMKQSQQNTRTVVLDNPFGQASSDHVLEPIFFIAIFFATIVAAIVISVITAVLSFAAGRVLEDA